MATDDQSKTQSFRAAIGPDQFTNLDAAQLEKLRNRRAVIDLGPDEPSTADDPRDSAYPIAGGFGRILTP